MIKGVRRFSTRFTPKRTSSQSFYEVLEVDRNAEDSQIKESYRRLARMYHPDLFDGPETKFKEISEAYETLKDEVKKQKYDSRIGNRPEKDIYKDMKQEEEYEKPNPRTWSEFKEEEEKEQNERDLLLH